VLCIGYIKGSSEFGFSIEWEDAQFVSTNDLSKGYVRHGSKSQQYDAAQSTEIKKGLAKWCSDANYDRKKLSGKQERGYQLPSLNDARVAFEVAIGGEIDWGDDAE
tara:strand:+ start:91 stop:408 length:318 start_codon:yes stop_codon:yes gene_type:complete